MISKQALEKNRKILVKHGHDSLSDEEVFEISKNIQQLADVIIDFQKKKTHGNSR